MPSRRPSPAACVGTDLVSLAKSPGGLVGVRETPTGLETVELDDHGRHRLGRIRDSLFGMARPFDTSARFLLTGLAGILVSWGSTPRSPASPSTRRRRGLLPGDQVPRHGRANQQLDRAGPGLKLFSSVLMLASLGFVAILTAGIINRLLDHRLTGIVGRRAIPRTDHVVVVGLGQVGLRLCLVLRSLGIGVVAVERDASVPSVKLARGYRIPVVIGEGGERPLLARLSLDRARALAAITSDDVGNIAISVAALALRDDLRVILRAGDGDVTTEIRSLFHIGVVRDVHRIAGDLLAALALGIQATGAATRDGETWLILGDGTARPFGELVPAGGR